MHASKINSLMTCRQLQPGDALPLPGMAVVFATVPCRLDQFQALKRETLGVQQEKEHRTFKVQSHPIPPSRFIFKEVL